MNINWLKPLSVAMIGMGGLALTIGGNYYQNRLQELDKKTQDILSSFHYYFYELGIGESYFHSYKSEFIEYIRLKTQNTPEKDLINARQLYLNSYREALHYKIRAHNVIGSNYQIVEEFSMFTVKTIDDIESEIACVENLSSKRYDILRTRLDKSRNQTNSLGGEQNSIIRWSSFLIFIGLAIAIMSEIIENKRKLHSKDNKP